MPPIETDSHGSRPPPTDTPVRVVLVLGLDDRSIESALAELGFLTRGCSVSLLEETASGFSADAVLVDMELPGALAAVSRLRRSDGVVSTVPVVLIGHAASEAGGDAFVLRPVNVSDVALRLRLLLELPGFSGSVIPPPPIEALPSEIPPPHAVAQPVDGLAGLSSPLATVLRRAAVRTVGSDVDLHLPNVGDDSIDDLIPPEILEPLDAPLESLVEDAVFQYTPTSFSQGNRKTSRTSPPPRSVSPTPTLSPLPVDGELRLAGKGVGTSAGSILGAAARIRASGTLVFRTSDGTAVYTLSLTAGHVLSLGSSRIEHSLGTLFVRLGLIPRDAAQLATASLDHGVRGAATLVARGFMTAETLAQSLSSAVRELLFDLLVMPHFDWEMRTLDPVSEVPISPRVLEHLVVMAARARIEPEDAIEMLGGAETIVVRHPEIASTETPLSPRERECLGRERASVTTWITHAGVESAPTLVALEWLGIVRLEGGHTIRQPVPTTTTIHERTRVRALEEAAQASDLFTLLGISANASRHAALDALDARRKELTLWKNHHGEIPALVTVEAGLQSASVILADTSQWKGYALAHRVGR